MYKPNLQIPQVWTHWPARFYWLEGDIEDYLEHLVTLGTWDNEIVQKGLSFLDKITGCRRAFERDFGSVQAYIDDVKGLKDGFVAKIQRMYQIRGEGDAGKYRDLVRVDDSTWKLLYTVMTGFAILIVSHTIFYL
jgi:hypothetical protein